MELPAAGWGVNSGAGSAAFSFLRPGALSGGGKRWAREEGTVTQFATTTKAGCMTCAQHAHAGCVIDALSKSSNMPASRRRSLHGCLRIEV